MRTASAILLMLCFGLIGSGAVEHLHNAHHASQDLRALRLARLLGHNMPKPPAHDESNCPFHLQLHLPALPIAIVPPMPARAAVIGLAPLTAARFVSHRLSLLVACRGPPARG